MARAPLSLGRAWAALAALTLAGVAVVSLDRAGLVGSALVADGLIVGFALMKVRIVCRDYLGLSKAPRGWRLGIASGVAVVLGAALAAAALAGGARP